MTNLELELQIFSILSQQDVTNLADQKELCRSIVGLFPPPNLTYYALQSIVEQLKSCQYTCEAGPLENNTAFLALCELADDFR